MSAYLLSPDEIDRIVAKAKKTQKAKGRVYMCNVTREHFGREIRGGPLYQQIRSALKDAGIYLRGRTHYYEAKAKGIESQSIPCTLGGIAADDSDVIDVSFHLGDELTHDMDEFLAEEVRNGNRRALRLLKSQIRRG